MNPPSSYKKEPNAGPIMYPTPIHISVYDINVATLFGNNSISIDNDAPHAAASATPWINLNMNKDGHYYYFKYHQQILMQLPECIG